MLLALIATMPAGADVTVPPHSISIDDVTKNEGNSGLTTFEFTATLSNPPSGNFTLKVDFATANGTATGGTSCAAGVDYVSTTGSVTFNRNQPDRPITVSVCGDTTAETNETFFVDLSNPEHDAVFTKSRGTGTITNDDAAAAPRSTTTTVECDQEEFQAGGSTECTATVADTGPGDGSPPAGTVSWDSDQTGVFVTSPCALVASGPESSACTVTYTSTVVGEHELTATYSGSLAHGTSEGSATVTVTPGPPAIVTVDPPTATNEIDTEHCVTATVTDASGNPTPGVTVFFTVTGSNRASGTGTTGADGTTGEFCYTGRLFGEDLITAVADADDSGEPDPGEPTGTATKTWLLPEPPLPCDVIVTEGGWIVARNGDRGTFGGNAHAATTGEVSSEQEYQDHGPAQPMNVHSIEVLSVVCSEDGKQASIFGLATINGSGQFAFRIDVEDNAEPGVGSDRCGILLSNGYDSGKQVLMGGNVQIHLQ